MVNWECVYGRMNVKGRMGGEGVVDTYDTKGDKDGLDKAFQGGFEDAEWAEGWG